MAPAGSPFTRPTSARVSAGAFFQPSTSKGITARTVQSPPFSIQVVTRGSTATEEAASFPTGDSKTWRAEGGAEGLS